MLWLIRWVVTHALWAFAILVVALTVVGAIGFALLQHNPDLGCVGFDKLPECSDQP